jgi:hypothetical protein
MREYIRRFSK